MVIDYVINYHVEITYNYRLKYSCMMKIYYADIGNSRIKLAEKKNGEWILLAQCTHDEIEKPLKELISGVDSLKIVTTSVRTDIFKRLEAKFGSHYFERISRDQIPKGMMDYMTPETLGLDRFLVAAGAYRRVNNCVIVIDAGTAITVDFMNKDGIYSGGVIMPGITVLQRAMAMALPELPSPSFILPDTWPGKSTGTSVDWGTAGLLSHSIRGYIEAYQRRKSNEASVVLTGGDAELVSRLLTENIRFEIAPFLLFEGMDALRELGKEGRKK